MPRHTSKLIGDDSKHYGFRRRRKTSLVTLSCTACYVSKLVIDDPKHLGKYCRRTAIFARYTSRLHIAPLVTKDDKSHIGDSLAKKVNVTCPCLICYMCHALSLTTLIIHGRWGQRLASGSYSNAIAVLRVYVCRRLR